MNPVRTLLVLLVLVPFVLVLGPGRAEADSITYNFTGTVTSVSPSLSGTFNTSQTLSGSFTYDSTTVGTLFGSDASGISNYAGGLTNFVMTVGSYTASPPFGADITNLVQVVNNLGGGWGDVFTVGARLTGTQLNGFNPIGFIQLQDTSQGAFSNTQLVDIGNLTGWTNQPGRTSQWYLAFSQGGDEPKISGTLTSISQVTAVPEPSSLALLGIGFAVVGICTRRR